MSKLSPAAARAKYEYNKKYVDQYWERRAAKMQGITRKDEHPEETIWKKRLN